MYRRCSKLFHPRNVYSRCQLHATTFKMHQHTTRLHNHFSEGAKKLSHKKFEEYSTQTTATTTQPTTSTQMDQDTKDQLFALIEKSMQELYPNEASNPSWLGNQRDTLRTRAFELPKDFDMLHNVAFPTFQFATKLCKDKKQMQQFSQTLATQISAKITELAQQDPTTIVDSVEASGPYINFYLKAGHLARIVPDIVSDQHPFLAKRVLQEGKENVMIEYSQPNTHKTFHVGHMRNAALGNSLVQLFEFQGHNVNAVNYIGDVGAHIAKCLWYYLYSIKGTTIEQYEATPLTREEIEKELEERRPKNITKVEWLGDMYQRGYNQLDLSMWTDYPHPGIITAKIVSIEAHPQNPKWKVLGVATDAESKTVHTVVCGGINYELNEIVAYAPIGIKKAGRLIQAQDMKGVTSYGLILSEKEFGLRSEKNKPKDKDDIHEPAKDDIFIFPSETQVGQSVTELGRVTDINIPASVLLVDAIAQRNAEVKSVLKAMEEQKHNIDLLWQITREWSIDDFKLIYNWVDCRFDHFFHESDVGSESKQMTLDAYEKGILIQSNGTIGADLSKYKLGYCMLLTSAGTGLYATKDLALAKKKFEDFHVDRSVYVVDVGQSLHFQQVFKTLELFGFEQAKKCYHLAYGIVTLPDGKMSSRKGNIIFFSKLKETLTNKITTDFMEKFRGVWSDEEVEDTTRKLAIATIKYGMLNQDNNKDIVFDMKAWTDKTGNTGVYLMYAYARTRSIMRNIILTDDEKKQADYSKLTDLAEKKLLSMFHMFHDVAARATKDYKPQYLCIYLFRLSQQLNKLYERVSVKATPDIPTKAARLDLIISAGLILRAGLKLLGITAVERM